MTLHAAILGWRPRTSLDSQNARVHWARRQKRNVATRVRVAEALAAAAWPRSLERGGAEHVITITIYQRLGKLMDSDNAAGCLKKTRDTIAEWLNVDDGQDGPEWLYRVKRGPDGVALELRLKALREERAG